MNTRVKMYDGSFRHVRDLAPGDVLGDGDVTEEGGVITSIERCFGPLVSVRATHGGKAQLLSMDAEIYVTSDGEVRTTRDGVPCDEHMDFYNYVSVDVQRIVSAPQHWRRSHWRDVRFTARITGEDVDCDPYKAGYRMNAAELRSVIASHDYEHAQSALEGILDRRGRIVDGRVTVVLPCHSGGLLVNLIVSLCQTADLSAVRSQASHNHVVLMPLIDARTWTGLIVTIGKWIIPRCPYLPLIVEPAGEGVYYKLSFDGERTHQVVLDDGTQIHVAGPIDDASLSD